MKKIDPLTVAMAGGCFFSFLIDFGTSPLLRVVWDLSWFFLFLAITNIVGKQPKRAFVLAGISVVTSLGWLIGTDTSMQVYWLCIWIATLFYLWPLRFLALGEITFALLFGPAFWIGTVCFSSGKFMPALDNTDYSLLILTAMSGVILFALAFLKNTEHYSLHRANQHYSLPVLLGCVFPSLDRKWHNHPSYHNFQWATVILYLVLCGAILVIPNLNSVV